MNRTDLLKALKAVIPGVAKGDALLVGADTFIFRDRMIQSYNDNLSITYPFDIGLELDDKMLAVKAVETVKVLEKMTGLDVQLKVKENSIEITDEVTTLSMRLIEASTTNLLESLKLEELDWQALPTNFPKIMSLCLASVSKNVVHGPLVGVHVNGNDALSSDNFRATWAVLSEPMEPFTIPGTAVADLLKLEGLEKYAVTSSWVHFMSKEGAVFSSRLLASEFPAEALKRMFPEEDGDIYTLPEGLNKALDRAGILTYEQDGGLQFVNLSHKDGWLIVSGERQYGSITDKVKIKKNEWPKGVSINIQPNYLIDIMAKTKSFQVVGKLVYFKGEDFQHIVATVVGND